MNLEKWFEKAMTAREYIDVMEKNKEGLQSILSQFEVPAEEEQFLANLREKQLRVIVLTEDWCGDAMLNVPILLKLAEKSGMKVKMLLRDQNLALIDQYLTNGTSRAIPIFIFMDQAGKEYAVWGPRAETLQQFVEDERAKLPSKEDESFAEKQIELYSGIAKKYTMDKQVWKEVYESIKLKL